MIELADKWTRQPQRRVALAPAYADALFADIPSICAAQMDLRGLVMTAPITVPARSVGAGGVSRIGKTGDRPYLQPATALTATSGMTLISIQSINTAASANIWHTVQGDTGNSHFLFSGLWYTSTFSTTRWLNGVSTGITTGIPHVAIVTADGTNRAAYVNGQLVGSTASGGSISISRQMFYGNDSFSLIDGDFYGVFLLPRSLSAAEVASNFKSPEAAWGALLRKRPKRIFLSTGGGSGATGTAAITLGGDTSSATGTTTVKGSAAPTLGSDTSLASGTVGSVSGTAAITLAGATSSAQGTTSIGGTGAVTLGNDFSTASGAVGSAITGSAAITLGSATSSATGTTKVLGSAAIILGADFSTTQGTTKILGSAAITLGNDFATAFGTAGTPTTVVSPRGLTIRIGLAL